METRGFLGRKRTNTDQTVPPGQYVTDDFPVLSSGPTPRLPLEHWTFSIKYANEVLAEWNWKEFLGLPHTRMDVDIHCVTKWSKLGTSWKGIAIETLLEAADIDPPTEFVMAHSEGDYTTNVPLEDLLDGKAMIAFLYEGAPLPSEHGGPARLFVPHLYFWKSAKWVRGLRFMDSNEPGFWEGHGYHIYGDPWREQRYTGD